MSEIKATSFRLQEDDIQKFKEFAEENNFNQAEMFTAVLNTFDLAKVKGRVVNRGKEIETFQGLMNNLVMMYTNSLIISQTSEERMREELHVELSANDVTILNLHEEKSKLKDEIGNYENSSKVAQDQLKELNITFNSLMFKKVNWIRKLKKNLFQLMTIEINLKPLTLLL